MTQINQSERARAHVWVTGRVQGVGFRAFVQQYGELLGLVGWVRNVGYDQVEAVAEGPRPVVEKFVEVVKSGPRASHIDQARLEWETPGDEFHYFDVRHSI